SPTGVRAASTGVGESYTGVGISYTPVGIFPTGVEMVIAPGIDGSGNPQKPTLSAHAAARSSARFYRIRLCFIAAIQDVIHNPTRRDPRTARHARGDSRSLARTANNSGYPLYGFLLHQPLPGLDLGDRVARTGRLINLKRIDRS